MRCHQEREEGQKSSYGWFASYGSRTDGKRMPIQRILNQPPGSFRLSHRGSLRRNLVTLVAAEIALLFGAERAWIGFADIVANGFAALKEDSSGAPVRLGPP
jgi:hypothetical protein